MLNFKIPVWSGLQILMRITKSHNDSLSIHIRINFSQLIIYRVQIRLKILYSNFLFIHQEAEVGIWFYIVKTAIQAEICVATCLKYGAFCSAIQSNSYPDHIIIVTVVIKFDSGKLKHKLHPCLNFKGRGGGRQHAGVIWNIFQNWEQKVEFWIKYKPNQTKTKKTMHKKKYNFISFVTLQSLHRRGYSRFFWGVLMSGWIFWLPPDGKTTDEQPRRNINHGSMDNHGQPWLNHGWQWLTKL